MKLLEMVKDKKGAICLLPSRDFYYETEDGFRFPVPADDIGATTLFAEDKALLFMRWIRKHLESKSNIS